MTDAETLHTRLARKPIVIAPGVYDAFTALVAVQAGFAALYVSGAAIAYTRLGRPDIGLVSMTEMAQTVAMIRDRVAARVRGAKAEARFEEYVAELRSAHDLTTNFAAASDPNADAEAALFTIDGTPYTVGELRAFVAELSPRAQERYQDPAAREKLLDDIVKGKEKIIEGVAGLSEEALEETVPLMAGLYPRKIGLYAYLGELFHHRGQIAFIRGTIRRLRECDPGFLK